MKASVDQDLCISCGACIDTCPEVFDWNEDDKAHAKVDEVPEAHEDAAKEAAEGCPTEAIKLS
ncbi:4Fe-4S ferredoxin iron-sulfur binding domain-containing protein [Desulfotomaculum nigrificans CO-1-SRB]|uniref:Ferredoxin n=1 Tax=Desulfotomaculum nigrificans (strain DSM 14880 / VKM B-2319 / CO-1-SRB) TaxID=868595 RepID=F6B722_DESCC|nr:ferredoxin [Desulfotomaculum nigrificans]AEF94447.1 4Fe-4S ferredoxin iron-sulfur binding domain-containing protein [Desulfotomaculum nigrificans CO-1-SRB]